MIKSELIKRSPIRVFEKTIHGGLGKGNLGVFTARKGVGKTACLAHLALDKMMRNLNVLHISFADDPHHVESWYRQVFEEVTKAYKLEEANDVFEEVKHHRIIVHFKQVDISFDEIKKSIAQVEGSIDFNPEIVIIDGLDFELLSDETIKQWKIFAEEQNAALWFAAVLHRDDLQLNTHEIPAPVNRFNNIFSVIIMLQPEQDYIDMKLLKDHGNEDLEKLRLKLDPETLLISNHRA